LAALQRGRGIESRDDIETGIPHDARL